MLCSFANSLHPPLFSEMSHIRVGFGFGHPSGRTIMSCASTAFSSQIRTFWQLGWQGPAVTLWQKVRI